MKKYNKSLYERIMYDVSKVVKKHLNEEYDDYDDEYSIYDLFDEFDSDVV